jgi:hypothetical protein
MPLTASDYLDSADTQCDMAVRADDPEYHARVIAEAQVTAIEAVAAAIVRLAEAVENLAGQAGKDKT